MRFLESTSAGLWAAHTLFVADFEVVPVLCTATVLVCYFLVLPNVCWRFLRCFVGTMAEDDDDDPNRLWYVCRRPAGEDKFMICCDCCHEWYHGECVAISPSQEAVMSRDNEKYVCPLCLQSSSDQFIQWPFPDQSLTNPQLLFSEAPALVLSFVTLYLMYMMKLYTGSETYFRFLLAPLERLLYWSFLAFTKLMQTVQAWNPSH